jgi:sulfite reductase alpha subunit-like flavoprotein
MGLSAELIAVKMRLQGAAAYQRQMQRNTAVTSAFGTAAEKAGLSAKKAAVGIGSMAQSARVGLANFGTRAKAIGNSMKTVGSQMTSGISLPMLVIGAASGKLAYDFDKSMRNVNSIAQLPEPAFNQLQKSVLGLAGKTAQAPLRALT